MILRYTITATLPGSPTPCVVHVDTDADPKDGLPLAVGDRLDDLLGTWRAEETWPVGWRIYVGTAAAYVGYVDYGPTPDPADPQQADLFGAQ